ARGHGIEEPTANPAEPAEEEEDAGEDEQVRDGVAYGGQGGEKLRPGEAHEPPAPRLRPGEEREHGREITGEKKNTQNDVEIAQHEGQDLRELSRREDLQRADSQPRQPLRQGAGQELPPLLAPGHQELRENESHERNAESEKNGDHEPQRAARRALRQDPLLQALGQRLSVVGKL